MTDFDKQLATIQEKVQQVLKRYLMLQKENLQLKKELEKCVSELNSKNEQLGILGEQVDVLKLGVQGWTENEKKLLEKRIDLYLKEIEKCLTLLNA